MKFLLFLFSLKCAIEFICRQTHLFVKFENDVINLFMKLIACALNFNSSDVDD